MLSFKSPILLVAISAFMISFILGPFIQSGYLSMIQGDLGDARLNNYFLENIYLFISGKSESLWHLGFFSPFPYVSGFSDNLFGASPVYLIARFITGEADTSFQVWCLFSYFANFVACFYALNGLGNSRTASLVGSLIFTFALPVTAYSNHAQLHYRFGVPLAITGFIHFLTKKDWKHFIVATFWLVWQFYCAIYLGFFVTLMLLAITTVFIITNPRLGVIHEFRNQSLNPKVLVKIILLISLLILLFYPYLRVTQLYGEIRSWEEIASMLPRPQSYLLSDWSWYWARLGKLFTDIPMRHEHQMFIGAFPLLLAVLGVFFGSKKKNGLAFQLLGVSLVGLIILTLNIGGYSLWFVFSKLPLASAIRTMTRIDLVFLFPVAYCAGVAVDHFVVRPFWIRRIIQGGVLAVVVFEFSATSAPLSSKHDWRARLEKMETRLPGDISSEKILFFSQLDGPSYASELDAMWVALNHGVKTLNGYSGLLPRGFNSEFGRDCSELRKRIKSYKAFSRSWGTKIETIKLKRKIIPLGFARCD